MPAVPTAYATSAGYSWEQVYTAGPNPQIGVSSGEYAPQIAFPTGDGSALLALYLKFIMPGGLDSFGALALTPNASGLTGPTPFTTTYQTGVGVITPTYLSALRIAAKSKTYVTSQGSGTIATGSGVTQFGNTGAITTTLVISASTATQTTGAAYDPATDRLIVAGSAGSEARLFLYDQGADTISQVKAVPLVIPTIFASVAFSGDGTKIYWLIAGGLSDGVNSNIPGFYTLDAATYNTLSVQYPTTSVGSGGDALVTFVPSAQSDKAIMLLGGIIYEYQISTNTRTLLCSFNADIPAATRSNMKSLTRVNSTQFLVSGGGGYSVYRMTVPYETTPTDEPEPDGCTEYGVFDACDTDYSRGDPSCAATYGTGGNLASATSYVTGGGCRC